MRDVLSTVLLFFITTNLVSAGIDLSDYRNIEPGKIYLVGEDHRNKNDKARVDFLMEGAAEGKLLLGREGLDRDDRSRGRGVFGIEEREVISLGSLFHQYDSFLKSVYFEKSKKHFKEMDGMLLDTKNYRRIIHGGHAEYFFGTLSNFFRGFIVHLTENHERLSKNEGVGKAFATLISSQMSDASSPYNNLILYSTKAAEEDLQALHKLSRGAIGGDRPENNVYVNWSSDLKQWKDLFDFLGEYFFVGLPDSVDKKRVREYLARCSLAFDELEGISAEDIRDAYERVYALGDEVESVFLLQLRNQYIFHSIEAQLSRAQEEGLPIYVAIGQGHLAGLEEMLERKGYPYAVFDTHEYLEEPVLRDSRKEEL